MAGSLQSVSAFSDFDLEDPQISSKWHPELHQVHLHFGSKDKHWEQSEAISSHL